MSVNSNNPEQSRIETENSRLAALFALDAQPSVPWDKSDLAALLRHQLQAPIGLDLGTLPSEIVPKLRALTDAEGLLLRSFEDLFHHPHPPVDLLRLVKDFAKLNRSHSRSALPPEVATVIYYAAIVVAAMRCGQVISELKPAQLRKGLDWALSQPWLDDRLRALFTEAQGRAAESPSKQ